MGRACPHPGSPYHSASHALPLGCHCPPPQPLPVGGGVSGWEAHGLWFYNVTTVGAGEGGVPCISVKYLIYLNINKNQTLCKIPCSLQLFWALGWVRNGRAWCRSRPLLGGSVDFSHLRSEGFLWFPPCQGGAAVSSKCDCSRPFSSMRTSVSSQICYSYPHGA